MRTLARWVYLTCLGLVVSGLLSAHVASARPGGGQGFSGGSRSGSGNSGSSRSGGSYSGSRPTYSGSSGGYSSGSGTSGGGVIVLGILLVTGVLVLVAIQTATRGKRKDWSTMEPYVGQPYPVQAFGNPREANLTASGLAQSARSQLSQLQKYDPKFSLVVFDDFLGALYTEVLIAQGQGKLARMTAYLSPGALQTMGQRVLQGVSSVLVGSVTFVRVFGLGEDAGDVNVEVRFESNLSRRDPQTGQEQAIYVCESWTLGRRKSAVSRAPDQARFFGCPNCTAPLDAILAGRCNHCGQNVATGAFDWVVRGIGVVSTEARGPMLTGDTAEEGTGAQTIKDPNAANLLGSLQSRDPAFDWNAFQGRVSHIFLSFQKAWAARDLDGMRPFLSDTLFAVQNYWVTEYKRQRLRNVTENPRLLQIDLARITHDTFFDAITVRVFATSLDYTLSDDSNKLVSGHRDRQRSYSEYWTFIRSAATEGPTRTDPNCPRCGAPLLINMSGNCTYCQAKITSGSFDWVLSRIEQDEVYGG